jgi:hypothetical protein
MQLGLEVAILEGTIVCVIEVTTDPRHTIVQLAVW